MAMAVMSRAVRIVFMTGLLLLVTAIPALATPTFQFSSGTSGSEDAQFDHPAGIAVTAEGDVWVVDQNNNRVQKFDEDGEYLGKFGSTGSGPGEFERPTGVAVDAEGNLWVTDASSNRIQKFNEEGEFLQSIGSYGSGNGQFSGPEGIAVDQEGDVWVADTYQGRLQEFDGEGEFIQVVGSYGSGQGQLGEPTDVDVAPNGDVWLADWQNNRIAVFNQAGEFVRQFGSGGSGNGQFERPDAVDVDGEGNAWVGDQDNHRIQKFDEGGEYVGQFGTFGSGPGEFHFGYPFGIATDDSGHIWIADANNDRMQKWRIQEALTCFEGSRHTDVGQPLALEPGDLACEGKPPLEYEIVAEPENGEITEFDPETGALLYTPEPSFTGLDTFTFKAENELESSAVTTFGIEVGEAVYCPSGESATPVETALPIELSCEGSPPLEYEIVAEPENGEITEFDPNAGTLLYSPDPGYVGFDFLEFGASNGFGPSSPVTFKIGVGDSPFCENTGSFTRSETALPIELSCEGSPPLEYEIVAEPENGEITEFDPNAGTLLYEPDSGFYGPDGFEFEAVNGLGPSSPANFGIEVGNNDPVVAYSFDEEEGEIARDSTGGHDATIDGAERTASGRYRSALDFDGEEAHLTAPGSAALDFTSEFTLSTWVRPTATDAWAPVVAREDATESLPYAYILYARGEGPGPALYVAQDESTSTHVEAPEALPLNEWSHLAVTSDGEHLRLYVNGELQKTAPGGATKIASGDLEIGASPASSQYFEGRLDEMRLYDRTLDAEEIADDRDVSVLDGFGASISGKATNGQGLIADPGVWLAATAATFEYWWLRCDESGASCEAIEGERDRGYRIQDEDLGHTLRVLISAEPGPKASVRSAPTDLVTEPKPEFESLPEIFGHLANGRTVSVAVGELSPESAFLTYQWRRCDEQGEECEAIGDADSDRYALESGDVGAALRVAVTATTDGGSTTTVSEPTEPVASALIDNTAPPTIAESEGELGSVLTADPGSWSAEADIDFEYQWQRCDAEGEDCLEVSEATDSSSAPTDEDFGSTLRVLVTAIADGERESARSSATSVVAAVKPANVAVPTISGQARTGNRLEGIRGTWSGPGPMDLKMQWVLCDALGEECEAITDATDGELTLTSDEAGSTIRLQVTAENSVGSTVAESTATAVVAGPGGPPPTLVSPPAISGAAEVDEELSGTGGTWSGASEYEYRWERCSAYIPDCTPVVGAEEPTYVATPEDVGSLLRFVVAAVSEDETRSYASATATQSVRMTGGPANTEAPVLEGAVTIGDTLSVDPGSWTGAEPISFDYRWQRCDPSGCSNIPGARESTYDLTIADAHHILRASVAAKNDDGRTIAVTAETSPVASVSPFNLAVPAISGGGKTGETLTASPGAWDGEATITYAYSWLRCDSAGATCVPITDSESSSYELDNSDTGHTVRVSIVATNSAGNAEARSVPSVPVSASGGPISTDLPKITGVPAVKETLTVSEGEWEGAETYAYQWQRCGEVLGGSDCVNIPGATSPSYIAEYDDAGTALRVAVTATGAGGAALILAPATVEVQPSFLPGHEVDALANTSLPNVSGEAEEGEVVVVSSGSWSSYLPVSYEYAWRRCDADGKQCVTIDGANEPTYVLQAADVGETVRGVVRAGNGSRARIAVSKPSGEIKQASPSNESPPAIISLEGKGAIDEETLVAEPGSWSGSGLKFAYQWQGCDPEGNECEDITDARAEEETFEVLSVEIGSTLRVVVTVSNGSGSDAMASAVTKVVAASPPANISLPEVSGDAYEDGTLEANTGEWRGTPELGFSHQWQRCNDEGEECEAIGGATSAHYVADAGDVGSQLRVVVKATNEAASVEATSEATEVIGPPFLPALAGSGPGVLGFAFVGRTLNAEPGEWEGHSPIEFAYKWQRCNEEGEACVDIAEATADSYLTTVTDLGSTVRVKVEATNSSGDASEFSAITEPVAAAAPLSVSLPVIAEGVYRPGIELETSMGEWSGSGPLEFAYQWQLCNEEGEECEAITGETDSTYEASAEDVRNTVRSVVSVAGPLGSEEQASEPVRILPPESTNTAGPTVSGVAVVDELLSAGHGEWVPEPDEFAYQWEGCNEVGEECVDIDGATESGYYPTFSDAGHTIRVRVIAQNIGETDAPSAVSSATDPINTNELMNLVPPALSTNDPTLRETISATSGTWLGEAPITYHYQWQSCWSASSSSCNDLGHPTGTFGAQTNAFTSSYDFSGSRFRIKVTAENSYGVSVAYSSISSQAKFGDFQTAPENVFPPSLYSGEAVIGDTLLLSVGIWSAADELDREWQRCNAAGEDCVAITEAQGEAYSPIPEDIGYTLRGRVTGLNSLGEKIVVSEPSSVVEAAGAPEISRLPAIIGTVKVGESLLANEGEWTGSPQIRFDYVWKRCDANGRNCIPLEGEEGYTPWEYPVTRADVGGTMRLLVTAANGWGSVTATSRPTSVVPAAGSVANLTTATWYWWKIPEFGEPYGVWGIGSWDGEPELDYQWQRCDPLSEESEELECVDISGATDPERYVPKLADVGFLLRLKETGSAPEESVSVFSEPTPGPVIEELTDEGPSYSGPTVPGATIKASSGLSSSAGLPTSTEYRFFRLGGEFPEEVQASGSPEYEISAEDLGRQIRIEMIVSVLRADEATMLESPEVELTTSEVEVGPTNDVLPAISGEAVHGATLATDLGEWHGGGGPLSYEFEWHRCDEEGESCTAIPGAAASAVVLSAADVGHTLKVAVTAVSGPLEETATSEPSSIVDAAVPPSNEELPTVSPDPVELGTADGLAGTWSGSDPVTFGYQWQGCATDDPEECLDIEGATETSLPLDRAVVGEWLRLVVTASNAAGSSTAASELVGPVESAPPPQLNTAPNLTVLGPPAAGSTLLTDSGNWEFVDRSELEYQWLRCDQEGANCEEIDAADDNGYTLRDDDVSSRLQVEVTAENSSERLSATSGLSPLIEAFGGSVAGSVVYLNKWRDGILLGDLKDESKKEIADCETLVGEACTLRAPSVSPNEKLIAVEVEADQFGESSAIIFMNFDGSEPRHFAAGGEPQWSPDGTELYFTVSDPEEAEGWQIVAVAADGSNAGEPETIFSSTGENRSIDFSPDGETIVYAQTEPPAEGEWEGLTYLYLGKPGDGSQKLDLGPQISSAFDPTFSADGSEIIFTATPTNPKAASHGGQETPLYGDVHRLWAMNSNGTNPHPIVPEAAVTYDSPSIVGDQVLASRRTVSWVSVGFGGFVDYSDPVLWSLDSKGGPPKATSFEGLEPSFRWGVFGKVKPPDVRDCPRGVKRCEPWGAKAKYKAAQYAYKYSEEDKDGPFYRNYGNYWAVGDKDCTSFISQAWHAAGHRFMYEFYPKNRLKARRDGLIWWGGKAYETKPESFSNYSFTHVEGFREHQLKSGRARILKGSEANPANLKTGDAVQFDWGKDGEFNHTVIVVESSDARYISAQATNRRAVKWSYFTSVSIPENMVLWQERYGGSREWSFRILRPTYRAANIPPKYR